MKIFGFCVTTSGLLDLISYNFPCWWLREGALKVRVKKMFFEIARRTRKMGYYSLDLTVTKTKLRT